MGCGEGGWGDQIGPTLLGSGAENYSPKWRVLAASNWEDYKNYRRQLFRSFEQAQPNQPARLPLFFYLHHDDDDGDGADDDDDDDDGDGDDNCMYDCTGCLEKSYY